MPLCSPMPAMALNCTGEYSNYEDAYHAAVDSLDSGKAYVKA